jgi:hypothetical protein
LQTVRVNPTSVPFAGFVSGYILAAEFRYGAGGEFSGQVKKSLVQPSLRNATLNSSAKSATPVLRLERDRDLVCRERTVARWIQRFGGFDRLRRSRGWPRYGRRTSAWHACQDRAESGRAGHSRRNTAKLILSIRPCITQFLDRGRDRWHLSVDVAFCAQPLLIEMAAIALHEANRRRKAREKNDPGRGDYPSIYRADIAV